MKVRHVCCLGMSVSIKEVTQVERTKSQNTEGSLFHQSKKKQWKKNKRKRNMVKSTRAAFTEKTYSSTLSSVCVKQYDTAADYVCAITTRL